MTAKDQPLTTANPKSMSVDPVDPAADVGAPTPDSVATHDPVGRRAQVVNGAVQGAGAGAGGGAPEDFDSDSGGAGTPEPRGPDTSPETYGDGRKHGSA